MREASMPQYKHYGKKALPGGASLQNCMAKNGRMANNEENARQRHLDGKDPSGRTVKKIYVEHGKAQKVSPCTPLPSFFNERTAQQAFA
jgi:hypothetical protein